MAIHLRLWWFVLGGGGRRSSRQSVAIALVLAAAAMSAGCSHGRTLGSYRPAGAGAWYGDRTQDGVTLLLRLEPDAAIARVRRTLQAAGYILTDPHDARATLQTLGRVVGGDTTMLVTVQVIPLELPEAASSIVLTATFDVPSSGVHNAPVIQRPGEENPLYGRLRALSDLVRESRTPAR